MTYVIDVWLSETELREGRVYRQRWQAQILAPAPIARFDGKTAREALFRAAEALVEREACDVAA
jgi:hypothetical protein